MKNIALFLLAASSFLATSAIARDFSIRNDPGARHNFVVSCRDGSGKSGSNKIVLQPGERMDIGDPACSTYTVSMSTANGTRSGRVITYTLDADHAYYIYWNGQYWDIAEDN
ncbi:hypothetical protein [Burkholderia sp. Ac-20353]|uniref:hypothetical protein n=1 Tax=Burkholderia sp. Ac-20353 TaxID=2703894 RepID=UPI00197C8E58|nr:hypothetical protein [Burkholderia sp. Ac-20353]MBN3785940.1 hypothetical protein [Burkholderia sp. Ac-20353]